MVDLALLCASDRDIIGTHRYAAVLVRVAAATVGLLDRGSQACMPCMSRADIVLQAGQGSQHVILGLKGGVAHTGAAAHAQLKLAKP